MSSHEEYGEGEIKQVCVHQLDITTLNKKKNCPLLAEPATPNSIRNEVTLGTFVPRTNPPHFLAVGEMSLLTLICLEGISPPYFFHVFCHATVTVTVAVMRHHNANFSREFSPREEMRERESIL